MAKRSLIHELAALRQAAIKVCAAGPWRRDGGTPREDAELWEKLREELKLPPQDQAR